MSRYSVYALLGLVVMTAVIIAYNPFLTNAASGVAHVVAPATGSSHGSSGTSLLTSAPPSSAASGEHEGSDDSASGYDG